MTHTDIHEIDSAVDNMAVKLNVVYRLIVFKNFLSLNSALLFFMGY